MRVVLRGGFGRWQLGALGAVLACTLPLAAARAATVVEGDPGGPLTGISYAWQVTLEDLDDGALVDGIVGTKSWAHPMNPGLGSFGLDAGWTHTSSWIHLVVEQEREVTFTLGPSADVPDGVGGFLPGDLVPAFSVWAGSDDEGLDDHFYAQGAVPHFVDDPSFAFLDHADAGPGPFVGDVAALTMTLAPGTYTVAVGGHDTVTPLEHMAGYVLVLPEPGALVQACVGAGLLAAFARRRAATIRRSARRASRA